MIRVKITNRVNFPEITLQNDLEHIAKNIIITDMVMGIDNSMAIMGGALPTNESKTIKRKGSSKSLIDTGELKSSFRYKTYGKNRVIIYLQSGRSKIGGYLQEGIKTNHGLKQYIFFGISKDAHDGAYRYMQDRIKELTSGFSS